MTLVLSFRYHKVKKMGQDVKKNGAYISSKIITNPEI